MAFTICAALLCGYSRKFAVRFSVFMSLPAIVGAFFTEVKYFGASEMTIGLGSLLYCNGHCRVCGMLRDPVYAADDTEDRNCVISHIILL